MVKSWLEVRWNGMKSPVVTVITIIIHVAARVHDASEWCGGARALNWQAGRCFPRDLFFPGARERCTEETPLRPLPPLSATGGRVGRHAGAFEAIASRYPHEIMDPAAGIPQKKKKKKNTRYVIPRRFAVVLRIWWRKNFRWEGKSKKNIRV